MQSLSQDVEQDQQQLQDIQSRAGVAHDTSRRQAAQIAKLMETVEDMRRQVEAAEGERDELRARHAALTKQRDGDPTDAHRDLAAEVRRRF